MDISLDGWDIERFDDAEWVSWGSGGNARAKVLGAADGYTVALVEAEPGYHGDSHADFETTTGATYLSIFKI